MFSMFHNLKLLFGMTRLKVSSVNVSGAKVKQLQKFYSFKWYKELSFLYFLLRWKKKAHRKKIRVKLSALYFSSKFTWFFSSSYCFTFQWSYCLSNRKMESTVNINCYKQRSSITSVIYVHKHLSWHKQFTA